MIEYSFKISSTLLKETLRCNITYKRCLSIGFYAGIMSTFYVLKLHSKLLVAPATKFSNFRFLYLCTMFFLGLATPGLPRLLHDDYPGAPTPTTSPGNEM